MKIAVVGQGAREHVMARAFHESPSRPDVLVCPGSDGMLDVARRIGVPPSEILRVFRQEQIDLCVVGEEKYLEEGLADACRAAGIPVWGPDRSSARLETSKIFAKEFMSRHGVPTARFSVASTADRVRRASSALPCVLKYDGLAAGKGVAVCATETDVEDFIRSVFDETRFGKNPNVLIEECLEGKEISVICAVSDGQYQMFVPARDYKRLRDGDSGPNTGGMGAVASPDLIPATIADDIETSIIRPVMNGLEKDCLPYRGFLYFGLMLTAAGPKVLEFNCRFGDPEAQSVFELMGGDAAEYLSAAAQGKLNPRLLGVERKWAVTVVLASRNYPVRSGAGGLIAGLDRVDGARIYHSGTRRNSDGTWEINGGRVLSVVASAVTREAAVTRVYREVDKIRFDGMQVRRDIGRLHFDTVRESRLAGAVAGRE